jgi:aspartyl-tRNA synthetase
VSAQGAFETGIAKFLEPVKAELFAALGLQPGDTVLFVADMYSVATKALGELRQKVARDMGIVPKPGAEGGPWNFLWVVDFPMFERDKESGRWVAMHHPFTSPQRRPVARPSSTPTSTMRTPSSQIVSAGYDIVLNGQEIAGGSVRIHDQPSRARSSSCSASPRAGQGEVQLPARSPLSSARRRTRASPSASTASS